MLQASRSDFPTQLLQIRIEAALETVPLVWYDCVTSTDVSNEIPL